MTPWRARCLEHDRVLGVGSLSEIGTQELNHHLATDGDCRSTRERIGPDDAEAATDRVATDGGTVDVCPRCDSPDFYRREPEKRSTTTSDAARYRCENGHDFEEPATRAPYQETESLRGVAQVLVDAAPDAVATDGGERDV